MGRKYDIKFKRVSFAEPQALMKSKVLSMFQKLAVKRAAAKGSETHIHLLSLNQRATISMLDAAREKMGQRWDEKNLVELLFESWYSY